MSSDPDALVPASVTDFVFDLHDSTRRSLLLADQANLYSNTFKDLNSKYFEKSAWPSTEAIASECESDLVFLALYKELTHRHYLSFNRPKIRDHIDGWNVYRVLFDLVIASAEDGSSDEDNNYGFILFSDWAFDILHEFVYQFQGFCQFRTTFAANAANSTKGLSDNQVETLELLKENKDVWAVETVMYYLHRMLGFVNATEEEPAVKQGHKSLGLFASVGLSRLECLLGDYQASLMALDPIFPGTGGIIGVESSDGMNEDVSSVFPAKVSLAYHAGVSFLMSRRYKDAIRVLGGMCNQINRGFKTGQLNKKQQGDQTGKNLDRMIALLTILFHITPAGSVDDSLLRVIRDRYGNQLSKIETGEEGYEDLFMFACPKFVNPAVPDYDDPKLSASLSQDVYKLQVKQFMAEMHQQQILRKLRSYMKLYTSISVGKLAGFNDMDRKEFLYYLLSYKHKTRQLEQGSLAMGGSAGDNAEDDSTSPLSGNIGSSLDIHYFLSGDIVYVDEAEKQRRFEHFFMDQIAQAEDTLKELEIMSTKI